MHKQELLPQKEVFVRLIAGRLSLSPGNLILKIILVLIFVH